jgi:KaiC/GvpD/RAD55 family RecA-like ATPase
MKKVFRSIIDIPKDNKPTIPQEELIRNYRAFITSNIKPEDPSYIKLYTWLEAHFRDHQEMPSIILLNSKAEKEGDEGVIAAIRDIPQETPYTRSNYREILKEKFEDQCKENLSRTIQTTWAIASTGTKVGKKELKGVGPSIEYFMNESRNFRMRDPTIKTEGNIRSTEDSGEVLQDYHKKKSNPNEGYYTFLDRIDVTCNGLKPGELMLIAGYVKQGKTILTSNLTYSGVAQGWNGLFVSLEMNYQEMRDMFYVLHASNPEWLKHPKYKNLVGKISYDKVTYGLLSELEYEFFDTVVKDFPTHKDFGELYFVQPTESLTPSKLEMLAYDYNTRLKENGKKLDYLVVDYVGKMVIDKNERYGDYNIDLNSILKRLKELALTFDDGRKLRVISPFQVNRTGFKEAEKNDGHYSLTALSNANEAERSADLIISTYWNDNMKKAGIVKIGCLAHRKGADFDPFEAHVNFETRQIRDFIQQKQGEPDTGIQIIPMDVQ